MAKKKTGRKNKICPAGIAWAKRTFDTYPSAYANMAASKYCKDPNYAKKAKGKSWVKWIKKLVRAKEKTLEC